MKLKLLDLFSGIGGFSLGLESTGYFKTIGFVEKDKFCQQVLKKNFKDIPIESEVRNVKGERYAADIITGGFPCQPFSVAGKRRGTNDDRYLWDETIRIIRECKPRWFIGENVEGIINIQDGLVLRQVQDDLEKEGFQVQCLVIPASGIGAWHQRKRVWILANSNSRLSIGKNKKIQTRRNTINYGSKDVPNTKSVSSNERKPRNSKEESKEKRKVGIEIRGDNSDGTTNDVSNTNSFGHRGWSSEGCTNERWSFLPREQEGREMGSETSRCDFDVSNSNIEGLEGHELQSDNEQQPQKTSTDSSTEEQHTWWQTQSSLCGVPDGISYELDKSRANRIKSLGNSIVPLIARELGVAIIKAEQDG